MSGTLPSQPGPADEPRPIEAALPSGTAPAAGQAAATGQPPSLDEAPAFDTSVAHSARVYDFWLGGKDNFTADRAAAEQVIEVRPAIRTDVRANRAFLGRAVRYLAGPAGIRQFLDIGTGLPSADNTHEVAQSVAPGARIVYVDNDPIVLAHARALLTGAPEGVTAYLDADLRDPEAILAQAGRTLDLTRPVAIMLVAVLHHIPSPMTRTASLPGCARPCRPAATW